MGGDTARRCDRVNAGSPYLRPISLSLKETVIAFYKTRTKVGIIVNYLLSLRRRRGGVGRKLIVASGFTVYGMVISVSKIRSQLAAGPPLRLSFLLPNSVSMILSAPAAVDSGSPTGCIWRFRSSLDSGGFIVVPSKETQMPNPRKRRLWVWRCGGDFYLLLLLP